jgi:hypothetical protein
MRSRLIVAGLSAAMLIGCTGAPAHDWTGLAGGLPTGPAVVLPASPADLSGAWNWSRSEILRMPPLVAALVGIVPEGSNTHARCESSGTLLLVQAGSSFSGTATKTANACTTNGGQTFVQPGNQFQIVDGRISGNSVHFSIEEPIVAPCPHRAVIAVEAGVPSALNGTGRCVLPGHPQSTSPLPFDPPPGGTSTTINWSAIRP